MIRKFNGSDRRILTFSAVHPWENIAPITLIRSLITLCQTICGYRSRFFGSNRRNARESIRQVGVLQIFLEEILLDHSDLLESVKLSFSELHLVLQKLNFLLQDCTRETAQLWMLMESDRVASQFRVLIRSIGTALDVLPLELIDVSEEVRELVVLLMKQARKPGFHVDPNDKRVKVTVTSIMNQFESGITPSESDLRWILDSVGIRNWSECNREIKFLESEIELECLNEEKRRLSLLSSLMGFMNNCRCVVFDEVDGEGNGKGIDDRESVRDIGILGSLNPDDFHCPISLEFMVDPVTIVTGHTYDRSSILKWFRNGNPTCPKTDKKLCNTELVPNEALRKLIQQYCTAKGFPFVDSSRKNRDSSMVVPASLTAEQAMKMLASFLVGKLENGGRNERNKAVYEVRLLSKTYNFYRLCLVEAGAIPCLLKLLSSRDCSTQENAIAGLLNLSKHSKGRTVIVENWGLQLIVEVLNKGVKIESRQQAAATLFYLASVEDNRRLIGSIHEAIPALIKLIEDGNDRGKKNGLVALFGLLMHPENHRKVLASGAVPLLINLARFCEREEAQTDSLAILATLAEKREGSIAILQCQGLNVLVELLISPSTSRVGKENCVSTLLSLSTHGGADIVALLVKNTSIMGCLYSVLAKGTSRASKKASALITVLHDFYERSSSGFKVLVIPQEQFVHVW